MCGSIESLRESRKNPQVLRLKLVKVRGGYPNRIIFFVEGDDDVGVYDLWIKNSGFIFDFEIIPGAGKEQLINFHEILEKEKSWEDVYFFVDNDFDDHQKSFSNLFVLDAYSIENLLCNQESLESLLKTDFFCAGKPEIREKILFAFREFMDDFHEKIKPINEIVFISRRKRISIESKKDRLRDFMRVNIDGVDITMKPTEVIKLGPQFNDDEDVKNLKMEFARLPRQRSCKGKYLIQAFRSWLKILSEEYNSCSLGLFHAVCPRKLKSSPENVDIKILASSMSTPKCLCLFLEELKKQKA